jgi:putative DNA primase/helicase
LDSDISKGELRKWKTEQAKAIKAFEEEQRAEQEGVAKKLAETFNKLLISGESDYLKRKGVEAHGLHFFNDGSIAIPARDIDENITTLQTINSNGKKRFSKGGKVKGSSHCIGEISEQEPVCFCEGYATGASIHEATGYAVVVCFDSGNIKPVIQAHRSKRPRHKFIIFADNDQWKPETGNVGVTKAKEAAKQYSCHWIAPDFKDLDTAEKPTDFNDFKQLGGDIKAFVANGLNSELIDDGCTDSEKINTFPELDETPCYRVYDRPIYSGKEKLKAGTYHHYRYVDKKTGELGDEVLSKWICTPLYIESNTHDKNSNNFGVFLRFKPTVGAMRQWCMPMAMLRGSGEDLKGELLGMGLKFDVRDNKKSLIEYINNQTPNKTIEISTKTGWYEEAFILPDHCIGNAVQTDSINNGLSGQYFAIFVCHSSSVPCC